jgi:autotransporter-associated beta strand protein
LVTTGATIGNESLSIAGQGVTGGGALRNAAGNNTWQGLVTLTDNATIGAASGTTLTIDVASGNAIGAANFNLTFDGAGINDVQDPVDLGTGSLTKIGSGTTILEANNTYSGNTTVSLGVLSLAAGDAIPDANTLIIDGGKVDLTSNETVGALVLGNATQGNGTYGSNSSTAANKDDTYFAGTGVLTVGSGALTPYAAWAAAKGLTPGGNDAETDDPDGDGDINRHEFAFDGDPLSSSASGKIVGKIAPVGVDQVLTLTLPVRKGVSSVVFSGPGDLVSAAIDGVIYTIQGSDDLVDLTTMNVAEVTPALSAGLPPLSVVPGDSGSWEYRTFRTPDAITADPRDFMRATVEDAIP